MRKPNTAITKVQVRHRAYTIYENFRDFLMEKHAYTVYNALEMDAFSAWVFCQRNANSLTMKFPESYVGDKNDQLRLWKETYRDGPVYNVGFLEYFEDDEGAPSFYSVAVESFHIDDLHKALECYMQRWNGPTPWRASDIRPTRRTELMDLRSSLTPDGNLPLNLTFSNKGLYCMLHAMAEVRRNHGVDAMPDYAQTVQQLRAHHDARMKRPGILRKNLGFAVKASATHIPDTDNLVTIFKDGKVVRPDSGAMLVLEDSDRVGYTGDKNNHGTGSLDHCNW